MTLKNDLVGKVFGRLRVSAFAGRDKSGNGMFQVECQCGSSRIVQRGALTTGTQVSCGCYQKERAAISCRSRTKHGAAAGPQMAPEYRSYRGMKHRCYQKSDTRYSNYGGRGIQVCSRWLGGQGYLNFLADMGRKPGPGYSLDRINNDGNYEPGNCRWATRSQQMKNRRPRKYWKNYVT